jgi:WD40 repeat protein
MPLTIRRQAAFSPDGSPGLPPEKEMKERSVSGMHTGARMRTLKDDQQSSAVNIVAFHPDGHTLMAADMGGYISVWDWAGGQRIQRWKAHQGVIVSAR